jgi:hypothetical protein
MLSFKEYADNRQKNLAIQKVIALIPRAKDSLAAMLQSGLEGQAAKTAPAPRMRLAAWTEPLGNRLQEVDDILKFPGAGTGSLPGGRFAQFDALWQSEAFTGWASSHGFRPPPAEAKDGMAGRAYFDQAQRTVCKVASRPKDEAEIAALYLQAAQASGGIDNISVRAVCRVPSVSAHAIIQNKVKIVKDITSLERAADVVRIYFENLAGSLDKLGTRFGGAAGQAAFGQGSGDRVGTHLDGALDRAKQVKTVTKQIEVPNTVPQDKWRRPTPWTPTVRGTQRNELLPSGMEGEIALYVGAILGVVFKLFDKTGRLWTDIIGDNVGFDPNDPDAVQNKNIALFDLGGNVDLLKQPMPQIEEIAA